MSTPTLPRIGAHESAETVAAALEEVGAVIVEDVLDAGQLRSAMTELEPHIEATDPDLRHLNDSLQYFFRGTRHVTGLVGKSPTILDGLVLHPTILGTAEQVLGPACANIVLNLAHVMVREPGAEKQFPHRDEDVWIHLPRPAPQVEVASMTALVDFTAEIGATVVAPGSHHWERDRQPEPHEWACAEMSAGSTVLYLGSTIHAGGTNRTDAVRPGVHLSYVVGWLRTEENNYLATPPDVVRSMPRRAQELIGYGVHDAIADAGGFLGAVDMRNPVELLEAGEL